ncbi:RNA-binding protein Musashi 2 [Orchesella cincta]|uniref:RNA-binding protein Musashi 2 n=1 Tax=Orchesella cincta TaxID=48709 RepID=A0A1D2MLV6_ORCCI|nr:RNA-binding protein Musashi 2 [Orchesella cincta]
MYIPREENSQRELPDDAADKDSTCKAISTHSEYTTRLLINQDYQHDGNEWTDKYSFGGYPRALVAASAAAALPMPKENGHTHVHIHHQQDTDNPLVVSMKLAAEQVHQLTHPGENGVTQEMVNANLALVNATNNAVLSVNNAGVGVGVQQGLIAAAQAAQQAQQQAQQQQQQAQMKPQTVATGTTTDGGGGLLAVAQAQQQQQVKDEQNATTQAIINATTASSMSVASTTSTNNNSGGGSGQGQGYESKLFVGGLSWQTSSEKLREYFSKFGSVLEVQVVVDPMTQRSRGFGFITFADSDTVRKIVSVPNHILDGKRIDPKHATPRNKQVPAVNSYKTKKIFVGGVSQDTTLEEIKAYFSQFGKVEDAVMLMDQQTMRHRGFGFVTFESDEVVERICEIHYHTIKDKKVECKKAKPKEAQAMAVTGLHAAFGHDAVQAQVAHHLSLTSASLGSLGAQRTNPAQAAYAFYGGQFAGMTGNAGSHHASQAAALNANLAAGLMIPVTATSIASHSPVTYSSIRSGLSRYCEISEQ